MKWGLENEPFRVWVVRLCHDSAEWGREPIAFIDARIGASAEGEESFRLRSIERLVLGLATVKFNCSERAPSKSRRKRHRRSLAGLD